MLRLWIGEPVLSKSKLEQSFLDILRDQSCIHGIQMKPPEREYRFHPTRKWRFDFAWPELMVAVEIDGGTWMGGRHSRGAGAAADHDKYNQAIVRGWKVLRFTNQNMRDPENVFEMLMYAMGALAVEPE